MLLFHRMESHCTECRDFKQLDCRQPGSSLQVGGNKLLFPLPIKSLSPDYDLTRDGQKFVAITSAEGSSQLLTLVQNWTAELQKK